MDMTIHEFIDKFYEILQKTYFSLNPLNPNNTEDNFQELLRHNIIKVFNCNVDSEVTFQRTVVDINGDEVNLKNNILPFRYRAQCVLHKEFNHKVNHILLRRL